MLFTGHFQNGYVTRDLDRAVRRIGEQYGVTSFDFQDAEIAVTTPAGEGTARFRVALAWIDQRQVELIQPESGAVDLYRAWLPADDSLRFHHLGMRCSDLDQVREAAARRGWTVGMQGAVPGIDFLYLDTGATLGHCLEYICATPEAWDAMGWPGGPLLNP